MTVAAILVGFLSAAADRPVGRLDLEPGDLCPGLVAEYRSPADPHAALTRVEPKPAFFLDRSSPHPRLPPGPFELVWSGAVLLREPGVTFSAAVGGAVTVEVDGLKVLDGRGTTDATRVAGTPLPKRDAGYYRVVVRYRALPDVPARLQLWWSGETFAPEPVPAWRLGHLAADRPPAVERDDLAARGRTAVGQLGCARCHASALPGVGDPPPGPSLADVGRRVTRDWLMHWLADPSGVRPGAHMPGLFAADRAGYVERWLVAGHLAGGGGRPAGATPPGDHRRGRLTFLGVGCAACHLVPDVARTEQKDLDRVPLVGIGDRMTAGDLAAFLADPHGRYPDGRMPRLPLTPAEARDVAAYLLLWSRPSNDVPKAGPPTPDELAAATRRLGAPDPAAAAKALLHEKGCVACHTGLGESAARDVPIRAGDVPGCHTGGVGARYALPADTRAAVAAYLAVAGRERHASPFADRQRLLARAGCVRCHQRDADRPPPIEVAGSTLGGSQLQALPFLRTPRLTNPHQKFTRAYLTAAVRDGVSGLRSDRFTYRMPAYGPAADTLARALAEADGERPAEPDPPPTVAADPTLATLHGARLAGSQGYGCVSCHVWNGKLIGSPDPGATGPDLTRTAGRLRRDWFDRYLEGPGRFYPGTPMPDIFPHARPAMLTAVLDGDAARQKDALWAYLAKGKDAPSPAPPPPVPVAAPAAGEPVLVAQVPVRLPDNRVVESLCLLSADHDLLVYDLAEGAPHSLFTGGQLLRNVQGRVRQFLASGSPAPLTAPPLLLDRAKPSGREFRGYDRLPDGVRLRWQLRYGPDAVDAEETLRFTGAAGGRQVVRELRRAADVRPGVARYDLPPTEAAPAWSFPPTPLTDTVEGSLERPGYRAVAYPRPKTVSGEDRVMPGAVAVRPRDGQVFVASLKTGELFALRDPAGDGKSARFDNYARGLFQDALSMLAEDDGLYVLHRRNLTKVTDADGDGAADRFDRVAALPHGVADTYDLAYGLARDRDGRFVFGYAPYANHALPGSGGAVRLRPGRPAEEVAFGMRNPLGFCAGPGGDVFFTDNQGEWVATNKLAPVGEGVFHGFPNRAQPQHLKKPAGRPAVWVPYGWARSINGVAYDATGGRFGPFAGQFFLAELMFGGAIVRADVEKVNGVYQGACVPFWGKGLLGPLALAFDPRGRLYVGGVTEPGWMAQPDRGALFRIDYTGQVPFEVQTVRARPRGFRVVFTRPADPAAAADPRSYRLEHFRYEYTGAYGSPELDRTAVAVERVEVSADGLSAELTPAGPLVPDRVYVLTADGVQSAAGERLVHPTAAYTLNEIPAR